MLHSETVVENTEASADQANQMGYWQPSMVPIQVYPVPVALGPYPIIIQSSSQIENAFPGKIPLYCGTCQAYGCKCFYRNGPVGLRSHEMDHKNALIQARSPPTFKTSDFSRKMQNSKSLRDVEQQHEHYKNAAVAAYFNYLKVAPTNSVHNKLSELGLLAQNFSQKLSLDGPKFFNQGSLVNGKITTSVYLNGQAPVHPSIELSHDNDISIYLHQNAKFSHKMNGQNSKKHFDNSKTSTPSGRYHTNGKRPKRSQVLCKFGNNCKFFKDNKCKFYHPVSYETKKNSIDITDYSIDDGSDIDFGKENQNGL